MTSDRPYLPAPAPPSIYDAPPGCAACAHEGVRCPHGPDGDPDDDEDGRRVIVFQL